MNATRRRALRVGGLAAVGAVGTVTDATVESPPDTDATVESPPDADATVESPSDTDATRTWPQYRGDAGNAAVVDAPGPAQAVDRRWRRYGGHLRGQPVVAGGLVVVGVDTDRRSLAAFDSETGRLVWGARLPGRDLVTTPAVAGDTLVSLTRTALCGVDLETGALRWRRQMAGAAASSVVVADQTAFVTSKRRLVAVDPADGSRRWQTEVVYVGDGPAVADGSVYVTQRLRDGGRLVAVDAATGDREWRLSFDHRVLAPPVVVDGTVYLSDQHGLTAVAADSGRVAWQFRPEIDWEAVHFFLVGSRSPPAVTAKRVFAPVQDGRLFALDAATGTRRWVTRFWGQLGGPLAAAETVFVAADDSFLYGVDRATGRRRWELDCEVLPTTPGLADETLFVTSTDGSLLALANE